MTFRQARRPNACTYIKILEFLALEICLGNANRPGEIRNMSLTDFENRISNGVNIRLVEILPHKTLLTQGPAYVALNVELEVLLIEYVKYIRSTVERSNSPNFLFLNSVGNQIHEGSFTIYMNKIWQQFQGNSKFTNTLLRKTAVTQVHKYHPHYQAMLSSRMNHTADTAGRFYFLYDKINTCYRMGAVLPGILEENDSSTCRGNKTAGITTPPKGKY